MLALGILGVMGYFAAQSWSQREKSGALLARAEDAKRRLVSVERLLRRDTKRIDIKSPSFRGISLAGGACDLNAAPCPGISMTVKKTHSTPGTVTYRTVCEKPKIPGTYRRLHKCVTCTRGQVPYLRVVRYGREREVRYEHSSGLAVCAEASEDALNFKLIMGVKDQSGEYKTQIREVLIALANAEGIQVLK